MNNSVSIIISTCNRADDLAHTLAAMSCVCVPEEWQVELIVVDNASVDNTPEVIQKCSLSTMRVRYFREERPGKSYALNTGIAASTGRVVMFTDDDVRLPCDWIVNMAEPIFTGKVAAMAGGVRIANHLRRSWMHPLALTWFASTENVDDVGPATMLGANCAFSREVLSKVPGYDVELGPGQLGFMDDVLFSWQLQQAGYLICSAPDIIVEHHFSPDRLTRKSLISRSVREGHSQAYFEYHVLHTNARQPRIRLWQYQLQLALMRVVRKRDCQAQEGMQAWEMRLLERIGFYQHYLKERRSPRKYAKGGMVKIAGERYSPPSEIGVNDRTSMVIENVYTASRCSDK